MDALRGQAEMDAEERDVVLTKVHEERQDESEAWKATTPPSDVTISKVRDET